MLAAEPQYVPPTDQDREIFAALVPKDHYLRRAAQGIDFERFRPLLASYYSPNQGRPATEPVLLLKLEFLQYHDRLSDRQVVDQAQVNVAYREFLELSLTSNLPDPSLLSRFRGRLGAEGHRRVFDDLIAQAREHGLVKDRLRLKDATHVIANVAVPATLRLVAQMRERLLKAVEPYDPERAEGERVRAEMIRASEGNATPEQRLEMRVTHLGEIVAWVDGLVQERRAGMAADEPQWVRLEEALNLAQQILADREHPDAGDAIASLQDSDARFGYHHGSYFGFQLDILVDEDSELITSLNTLPANGDEAADAADLVRQEEEAHHNDIEALSADAILHQGPKLRELTDPEGLNLEVFVPPVERAPTGYFPPQDFRLDRAGETLTCPRGATTTSRRRTSRESGWVFQFNRRDCEICPLLKLCMPKLPKHKGRSVHKGEYVAEYAAVRAKAKTARYAEVRKKHPKVERKLAELVRYHGARRARFRGRGKVLLQHLMTALVVNARRFVQLLRAPTACSAGT